MSLDQLKPANPQEVNVYKPYYQGRKRNALPYAISLYREGNLEGSRNIEGGDSIPFVATWSISSLPADLTRFRIMFDGDSDLSYELMMANFEFIDYLIEVLFSTKKSNITDFSQTFYRKLLRVEE